MFEKLKSILGMQALRPEPFSGTVHISCVVDDHPKFRMQAWNWLLSLRSVKTRCRIFIHHTPGTLNESTKNAFQKLGATLVEISPFGNGDAAYCNKIRQLETEEFTAADFVILSDADIAFYQDPSLLIRDGVFRARTVDAPNPPAHVWGELLSHAQLSSKAQEIELEMYPGEKTFSSNFNGGLYVFPGAMAGDLLSLWTKYARFCLEQEELLGDYVHHSDQLGIGLALLEGAVPFDYLPSGANLPSHFPASKLELLSSQEVTAVHYHSHVDQHGLPCKTGVGWIDNSLCQIRERLINERRKCFLNEIFWDFRYAQFPELGSGLGSRDEVLAYKQKILRPYMEFIAEGSILDVGCGDLEVYAPLPAKNYVGIDLSAKAIAIAKAKRPDWQFEVREITEYPDESFDYTSCIDVLIHQPDNAAAEALASDLVRVARKGVIFSIHSSAIEGSGISFDSCRIKAFIESKPEISSLYEMGSYRDVTLYFAEKRLGERMTRYDAGLQELVIGAEYTEDLSLLKQVLAYSRDKIGFFPTTVIRFHEYPWFVKQMKDCAGKRILDVGAGVCFLPFYLVDHGARVTTIDKHEVIRNEQPMSEWNEWGFLDYSTLDPRIRSFNADMSQFEFNEHFDIIYSVSVIEHMPAEIRRSVLSKISELLLQGGRLLLSLDIIPGTNLLWNRNEGSIVDERDHGSLCDIKRELSSLGLNVIYEDSLLNMPLSCTDVVYLICKKE